MLSPAYLHALRQIYARLKGTDVARGQNRQCWLCSSGCAS